MRVNSRVFTERTDMLDGIQIPNCHPTELRKVAERIMNMVTALDYSVWDYNSVTELDKKITVDYWRKYDGLEEIIGRDGLSFCNWFIHEATEVSTVERAMRWLTSHNYLLIKPEVLQRAMAASNKFRQAVRGK